VSHSTRYPTIASPPSSFGYENFTVNIVSEVGFTSTSLGTPLFLYGFNDAGMVAVA
jgi:hypothetical protein